MAETVLSFEKQRAQVQAEVDATIASVKQLMEYADKMESGCTTDTTAERCCNNERVALQKELDTVHSKLTLLKHDIVKQYDVRLAALVDRLNKDQQLVFEPLDGVMTLPPQNEVSRYESCDVLLCR